MNREQWNQRYAARDLVWTAEANQFVVSELTEHPRGTAVDLACGEGRNTVWLAEGGFDATGVDWSQVALDKARRLAEARGVSPTFVQGDLASWTPEGRTWDVVLLAYLHLPWASMQRVLAQAAEAVARGGTLLVVGHASANLDRGVGGPQDPDVLYGPKRVAQALAGLQIEKAEHVTRSTASGDAIDVLVRARRS
ncbi:MAG: class I SAM-dependent methyltransferase [Deltaproteobacteria bacterium]|nr:class I SAM-dependent methyltransferase [Deltaproteobacteria bacterium]